MRRTSPRPALVGADHTPGAPTPAPELNEAVGVPLRCTIGENGAPNIGGIETPFQGANSFSVWLHLAGWSRLLDPLAPHIPITGQIGPRPAPSRWVVAPHAPTAARFRPVRPPRPPAPAGAKPVGPDLCRASTGPNRYTTRRSDRELCPRGLRSRPRAPLATTRWSHSNLPQGGLTCFRRISVVCAVWTSRGTVLWLPCSPCRPAEVQRNGVWMALGN